MVANLSLDCDSGVVGTEGGFEWVPEEEDEEDEQTGGKATAELTGITR